MIKTAHVSLRPSFLFVFRAPIRRFLGLTPHAIEYTCRTVSSETALPGCHPREGGDPVARKVNRTYSLDSRVRGNDALPRFACGHRLSCDLRGNNNHSHRRCGGEARARRQQSAGFTLIELAIVVFLIGVIAAMSIPQLLPIIAFSELEGSARRVAGFGQGAMAHSALLRDRVVVRIDLKEQQIYAVHWILPETEKAEAEAAEAEPDQLAKLAQLREMGVNSSADLQEKFLGESDLSGILSDGDGAFDPELAGYQMDDKFNSFARQALEVRAKNVKHDESFLEDAGTIFGEDQAFELDEEEPVEEELGDPILRRTALRGDVRIVGVEIDGDYISQGVAEAEFSVLGLTQSVLIYIENEDGEAYTVFWDPLSNRSTIHLGRGIES